MHTLSTLSYQKMSCCFLPVPAFIGSEQFVAAALGFSCCAHASDACLLVSSAIYCNSLFSRDYLDKREELRHAREERFVHTVPVLPFGCLRFFTVLSLCMQKTLSAQTICIRSVALLKRRMKSSCEPSNK